jgi:ribosomal protein S12 methylthiotransferase accessory factor
MKESTEIIVTLPSGRRVDAQVGRHVVHTDQPRSNGGEDSAPSPFQLFLAAIGACAGIFVQGFCATRGLSTAGVRVVERPSYADDGTLIGVDLTLELPADFPEKYRDAVVKVVEQCSVKRAIAAQPKFTVQVELAAPRPPRLAGTALATPSPHVKRSSP